MTIRNIAFTSRESAESLSGRPDMAVISITDPGTEQAKLATKRLVVIRDNLTPEQREKASAILDEEHKKLREEHARNGGAAPQKKTEAANKGK